MKTVTFDESKWRLVPVDPTAEMINAGEGLMFWGENVSGIFRGMLDEAPTLPDESKRSISVDELKQE